MGAMPDKAGLEMISEATATTPHSAPLSSAPWLTAEPSGSDHATLQALLAVSALNEEIRQRGAIQRENGAQILTDDVRQSRPFALDDVLQLIAERAVDITVADGVGVALVDGDDIVCRACAGKAVPDIGTSLDPNSGFSGICLKSGQIVRCDDSEIDTRVDALACQRLGARSMVAVPLTAKQTVIGLVEAFSSEPYGFDDSDVCSLILLAKLILSTILPQEDDRLSEPFQEAVSGQAPAALDPGIPGSHNELSWPVPDNRESSAAQVLETNCSSPPIENDKFKDTRSGVLLVIVLMAVVLLLLAIARVMPTVP
jgi:putative methionine-R-sulfoxide reductase with GAF domain